MAFKNAFEAFEATEGDTSTAPSALRGSQARFGAKLKRPGLGASNDYSPPSDAPSNGVEFAMPTYDLREFAGMWSVVDSDTDEIAKINDVFLEGLTLQDAEEAADALNAIEASRLPRSH